MTSNRLPAIVVNDSTLADAAGLLSCRGQIDFAVTLQQAGVDEIEISAGEDAAAIGRAVCSNQTVIRGPATKATVDVALHAGLDAVHLVASLRTARPALLKIVRQVVTYAVQRGLAVALDGEDASRADLDLIFAMIAAAETAGARRFRYTDTTGVLHPIRTHDVFRQLCAETDLELEFRGYDHFGLATANTLAAIEGGATHISVSALTADAGPARLTSVIDAINRTGVHHTRVNSARLPAPVTASTAVSALAWSRYAPTPAVLHEIRYAPR
jgi:homocitrate synthase NifV